ncbi:MAG: NAD(P)-dependent glycerol-3-phosphate dehydrogenase [Verrucomicrobiae bacterium]|nr:NAD(P)-dependent glycerol-3-phosphate dehydrogenase [Verrucomicrobiae bacterium]
MKIAVLGNGAWGSGLAALAERHGHKVALWGPPFAGKPSPSLPDALSGAEMVILAVPSHVMREVCADAKPHFPADAMLVSVAKGIELDTDCRMSEIIEAVSGRKEVAVLSGPSFASEVLKGLPTAVVCASALEKVARKVQETLSGEDFRIYTSHDVVGVEFGGALKNVMAIAAGACAGLGLGENALAAMITRGVAELARVGTAFGGEAQTFFGLSGMGDLMLTCSSSQSRNYQVGEGLGRGKSLDEILRTLQGTAEGVKTAKSVRQLLQLRKLEAPILDEVYRLLYEGKTARAALRDLMTRELKKEVVLPE